MSIRFCLVLSTRAQSMKSLSCKTVKKQNRPENMKNCVLAKENVIVYKESVSHRKSLENLNSEELKNHKTGGAKADQNSENEKSGSQMFVFDIKPSDIRNKSGDSDSCGNNRKRFPDKNGESAVKNVIRETHVIVKRLFKNNHQQGRDDIEKGEPYSEIKMRFLAPEFLDSGRNPVNQFVDADIKNLRDFRESFNVRLRFSVFPVGNRLPCYVYFFGELFLGDVVLCTVTFYIFG